MSICFQLYETDLTDGMKHDIVIGDVKPDPNNTIHHNSNDSCLVNEHY